MPRSPFKVMMARIADMWSTPLMNCVEQRTVLLVRAALPLILTQKHSRCDCPGDVNNLIRKQYEWADIQSHA